MSRKKIKRRYILNFNYFTNNFLITLLTNRLLKKGKKKLVEKIIINMLLYLKNIYNNKYLYVFEKAINNISPITILKYKIIDNIKIKKPILLNKYASIIIGINWLINSSFKRNEKKMSLKLTNEIIDSYKNIGFSIKKKLNMYESIINLNKN